MGRRKQGMGRGKTTAGKVSGTKWLRSDSVPEQVRQVGIRHARACHRARPLDDSRARWGVSAENAEVLPLAPRKLPLVSGQLGRSKVRDSTQISESTDERTRSRGRGERRDPERSAGTGHQPGFADERAASGRGAACARCGCGPISGPSDDEDSHEGRGRPSHGGSTVEPNGHPRADMVAAAACEVGRASEPGFGTPGLPVGRNEACGGFSRIPLAPPRERGESCWSSPSLALLVSSRGSDHAPRARSRVGRHSGRPLPPLDLDNRAVRQPATCPEARPGRDGPT